MQKGGEGEEGGGGEGGGGGRWFGEKVPDLEKGWRACGITSGETPETFPMVRRKVDLVPVPNLPLPLDLSPNPRFSSFQRRGTVSQYLTARGGGRFSLKINPSALASLVAILQLTQSKYSC